MKLLPCPCCGSSVIYAGVAHAFGYHVKCNGCGLRTRDFNLPDFCGKKNLPQRLTFAAMEAWNMRQPSLHNAELSARLHQIGSDQPARYHGSEEMFLMQDAVKALYSALPVPEDKPKQPMS